MEADTIGNFISETARTLNHAVAITPFCPMCEEYAVLDTFIAIHCPLDLTLDSGDTVARDGFLTFICQKCRTIDAEEIAVKIKFWISTGSARSGVCG